MRSAHAPRIDGCKRFELGLHAAALSSEDLLLTVYLCCSGFFYVKNHGVPQELIDREFEVNKGYATLNPQSSTVLQIARTCLH